MTDRLLGSDKMRRTSFEFFPQHDTELEIKTKSCPRRLLVRLLEESSSAGAQVEPPYQVFTHWSQRDGPLVHYSWLNRCYAYPGFWRTASGVKS